MRTFINVPVVIDFAMPAGAAALLPALPREPGETIEHWRERQAAASIWITNIEETNDGDEH